MLRQMYDDTSQYHCKKKGNIYFDNIRLSIRKKLPSYLNINHALSLHRFTSQYVYTLFMILLLYSMFSLSLFTMFGFISNFTS